jgi:hypothetical protein
LALSSGAASATGQAVVEQLLSIGGGVNLSAAINQLKEDECLGLANIVLDEQGGGAKRRGLTNVYDFGFEVISIYVFYRGTGPNPQIIAETADGKCQFSADAGVTWTTMVTGLNVSRPLAFETFNDKLYMVNGADGYMVWDGAAMTMIADAPNGKFLRVWKDTMWVSGTDDDRIWASDPGNADVYTVGNWVDLGKGDGDSMTGLATDGNVLICPKHRRGFLIFDPTTFANRIFDPDKGAESHFSFIHYGENLYYLSRDGICIFLGDSPSTIISQNIDPIFQADVLNFELSYLTWAYSYNNRIGWTVPEFGTGTTSLQIELLPRSQKRPYTFHRMPVRCFTTLRQGTTERLLGGKAAGRNVVDVFKGGDDDGVPFVGVIETKWFDLDNAFLFKYLRRMILNGRGLFYVGVLRNYEVAIRKTIAIDLVGSAAVWDGVGDVWGDETWGPHVALETIPLHPDVYGRSFKFRFSDSQTLEGLQAMDVGDVDYQLVKGSWALYGGVVQGIMMGSDL